MKGRIDSLQAVRAIACLLIFMHHCYICGTGALGAAIFIMLSGFLMCLSYYDRSLPRTPIDCLRFSARKIWKLYPLHIAMLLIPLSGQIYGLVNGLVAPARLFEKLAANALLVHAWIPLNDFYFSFNVPSWYLSVGLFLYFMLPVVLRAMDSTPRQRRRMRR